MTTPLITEEELQRQLAEPSSRRATFSLVVRLYSKQIYWQIRRMVYSHEDADDLVQNTFIKAWEAIEGFRGEAKVSTWLYRIAYNVFYDYTRSNKHTEDLETTEVARRNAEVSDTTVSLDIYEALNRLSNYERICVTLQLMEGQPIDKIAEITGMAAGTVKSHLFRGKEKMTRYLKENGYDRKR